MVGQFSQWLLVPKNRIHKLSSSPLSSKAWDCFKLYFLFFFTKNSKGHNSGGEKIISIQINLMNMFFAHSHNQQTLHPVLFLYVVEKLPDLFNSQMAPPKERDFDEGICEN